MKKAKSVLSALMVAVMLLTLAPLNGFAADYAVDVNENELTEPVSYKTGDIIEFGSYPQSKVTDEGLIESLNSVVTESDWVEFGSIEKGNLMKYADIQYKEEKYRALYFTEYKHEFSKYPDANGNESTKNYQEINGYYVDTVYWFKFDTLRWEVLDTESGLAVCENIIDAQAFNDTVYAHDDKYYGDTEFSYFANNYAESSLREWLNSRFYTTAFNDDEKKSLKQSSLNNKNSSSETEYDCDNTMDNVFILSVHDLSDVSYGFNSDFYFADQKRKNISISDYAYSQGCYPDSDISKNYWWVRNYSNLSNNAGVVINETGVISCGTLYAASVGVRPAIILNNISDNTQKISINKSEIYSDSSFIQYGSPKFTDSLFEFSNNGVIAYNNRSNTTVSKVSKESSCPTNSNYMLKITTDGVSAPGLGGFVQSIQGRGVYYHIFIAKIPKGYSYRVIYNTLYYDAKVKYLTSTKGTGDWALYITEINYGINPSHAPKYNTAAGYVYLVNNDAASESQITWYVGYSNIFDNTGTTVFNDGNFASSTNSIVRYNNNSSASDTVSVTRVTASTDCPTTSGYMMKIQTSPGTSSPGLGGFYHEVTPERGKTYYHKILAKIPKGYYLSYKANRISADFEWITDNEGTGDWETYIYKVTVPNNPEYTGTFGYVALYPDGSASVGIGDKNTTTEAVSWYVAYANVFKNYEFSNDLKATDLIKSAIVESSGHTYVAYNYSCSWSMAKIICEKIGGHLATITSSTENSAIASLVSSVSASSPYYWLGGTDAYSEGSWRWITGEAFSSFTKWSSGQPDNYLSAEHYLEMWTSDGYWNDNKLDATYGFVCEFDNYWTPIKTVEKDGHLYSLYNEHLTWSQAESRCQQMGGHLVTIKSEEEQALVEDLLKYGVKGGYYIGCSDTATEGTWKWVDTNETFFVGTGSSGTALGYNNWDTGEPNNGSGVEDCGGIYANTGKWNDYPGGTSEIEGFICEIDTTIIKPSYSYCHNGTKYEIYDKSLSWTDANLFAQMQGGHLLTITSQEEQDYINTIITGHSKYLYWMGANYYNNGRYFRWSNNEEWGYTNWKSGEPSAHSIFNKTPFIQIVARDTSTYSVGQWNDEYNAGLTGDWSLSNTGLIIEYDDYYETAAVDEQKGAPVNYFVAPSADDGWAQNADGTLSTSNNGVTVKYDPSDETFLFDSGGNALTSDVTKTFLYKFDLFKPLKENQYLTLSAHYVSGSISSSNTEPTGYCIVMEGEHFSFDGSVSSRTCSARCALDVRNNEGVYFNSDSTPYKSGPLAITQTNTLNMVSVWLFIPSGETITLDNYKIKFSVNITDEPVETPEYSRLAQKVLTGGTYGSLLNAPEKTGYDFVGWKYGDKTLTSQSELADNKNHVITAEWSAQAYTVNFNCNGGVCPTASKTVYYDSAYGEMPTPTKEGYFFLGWYTKKKGGNVVKEDYIYKLASDVTLYACWAKCDSNICGENLIWTLDDNKLIISGTGDMLDFTAGNAPWSSVSNYINSIEIQSGVNGIGDYAFYNLTSVRSVELSQTLNTIGEGAFENCLMLESVTIPDGVKTIEPSTFQNCISLTELLFPYSVSCIEDCAFDGCNNVSKITVINPKCVMPDGWITSNEDAVIYGYSNSTAQAFADGNDLTFVSIGYYGEQDGILWIFTDATEILQIIGSGDMPDYPENIVPWNVIKDEVKTVVFSDEITYIGSNSLQGCTNVSKITFPQKLVDIGINALEGTRWFENCDSGIVTIKTILYAYKEGVADDNVVICNGITRISSNFSSSFKNGVDSPISLQIPNTVSVIKDGALSYASELTTISVNSGNQYYKCVNNVLYSKDGKQLVCYPAGLNGNITVPESVTEIRPYAFAGCESMEEISIGKNVTYIADNAFESTTLTTIYGYYGSYAQSYAQTHGYDFVPYTSTVTLDCNDDDGTVITMTVNTGCAIGDLYVPAQNGYKFTGWYLETDDEDVLIASDYIVNEDITLYAYWEEIPEETPYIVGIIIKNLPTKTEYFVGDSIVTDGMELTAQFSDGTEKEISEGFYCVPSKFSSDGVQNVTVTYSGVTASFGVNVKKIVPASLTILTLPDTVSYFVGQSVKTKGLIVLIKYNNGTQRIVNDTSQFEYVYDFSTESSASDVTLYYSENGVTVEAFYQVSVTACPQIYSETLTCNSGDEFLMPVYISGNTGLMGCMIYVTYDPSVMTPSAPGCSWDGDISSNSENGTLRIIWYNSSQETTDGRIFNIPFKVSTKAEPGEYNIDISFSEEDTFNENFDNVKLECQGASLTVISSDKKPTVYSDDIECRAAEYVDVPIYIENNVGIEDATYLTFNFDASTFTYVECVNGIGTVSRVTGQSTGNLKIRLDEVLPDAGDGCLITVRLLVADKAVGKSLITLSIDDEKWVAESFEVLISKKNSKTELYAETVSAKYGETITVPVCIKDNDGIMGYVISAEYDTSKLKLSEITFGETWSKGLFEYNDSNGLIDIIWTGSESIDSDGVVFYLKFIVNDDLLSGNTEIMLSYDSGNTYNELWESVNINCTNVSIAIEGKKPIVPVDGTETVVEYTEKYIYGILPGMSDLSANITSVDGYSYTLEKSGELVGTSTTVVIVHGNESVDRYTVILFGDVNGDGWYDGTDAMIVSCIVNGLLTREQVGDAVWMAADCNYDGVIDQADVDLLNQAGVLLANIDQSQSEETLMTDSSYEEYLNLIDQQVEVTSEETTEDNTETPIPDKWETFIRLVINLIKQIFSIIKIY